MAIVNSELLRLARTRFNKTSAVLSPQVAGQPGGDPSMAGGAPPADPAAAAAGAPPAGGSGISLMDRDHAGSESFMDTGAILDLASQLTARRIDVVTPRLADGRHDAPILEHAGESGYPF